MSLAERKRGASCYHGLACDTRGDLGAYRYRRFLMVSILALLGAIGSLLGGFKSFATDLLGVFPCS
jgi:hypothetical protein